MIRAKLGLTAVLLGAVLAVAACGSSGSGGSSNSNSPAATPTSSSPAAAPSSSSPAPATGVNADSAFCGKVKVEQANVAKLETSAIQAFESGKFSSIQAYLRTYFGGIYADAQAVESTMGGAPANVQAAIKVINQFFQELIAAVNSTTTIPELEQKFEAVGNNPEFKSASEVLAAYGKEQCGDTLTASPAS